MSASHTDRYSDDAELHPPGASLSTWVGRLADSYEANVDRPEIRRFAMAFVEFWLYGMRDDDARGLLSQWLQTVRATHSEEVAAAADELPIPPEQVAALILALDVGIALQRLVDPGEVPSELYTTGIKAILNYRA